MLRHLYFLCHCKVDIFIYFLSNEMKNQKYHTEETIINSNINIVEIGKIDAPNI